MDLIKKIEDNIRSQFVLNHQVEELNLQLVEINKQRERLSGSIQILSELFREQTGMDLQQALNQDEGWGRRINELQVEAKQMIGSGKTAPEFAKESQPKEVETPRLRRLDGNKTIEATQKAVAEPTTSAIAKQKPKANVSRNVPKIVIDNEPPRPLEGEEHETVELDDED